MHYMAVGAIFFTVLLFIALVFGFGLLCYEICRKHVKTEEMKQLINRLRDEED